MRGLLHVVAREYGNEGSGLVGGDLEHMRGKAGHHVWWEHVYHQDSKLPFCWSDDPGTLCKLA